ncbi:MAG: MAPEG family protein [Rhodopseudomonas sp.]|uniref:MAPEG family protein n=1 Tax=Rhodopseudomonas sp. TaxID=1078 RepID=UPI001797F93B|nr:MAPEG family protein [Rhodopseudomonas sp.]NVN86461.1 MAPEG family protein [Rhodopseudomonas sp.]
MHYPALTAVYGGIFGLMFVALSIWVVAGRAKDKVHHGDGGVDYLNRRIRAHGNFAEYVPLALLLVGWVEGYGAAPATIHTMLAPLVVARLVHPIGMLMPVASFGQYALRAPSVTVTWIVIAAASIILLATP